MENKISTKGQKNLNILRQAIKDGDSVKCTMRKLSLDLPIPNQISFMVRNGRFISNPLQLDLFGGLTNDKINSKK
jgi:hypothetical protein